MGEHKNRNDAGDKAPADPLASGNEVNANIPHRDSDNPQVTRPQQPGGGGAPGTGDPDATPERLEEGEEARHQRENSARSRAESGTP
jgi:hypothetical protein